MTAQAAAILESALHLSPAERAEVLDGLVESFDREVAQAKSAEAKWKAEAESRLDAYLDGRMGSVSAEEMFRQRRERRG